MILALAFVVTTSVTTTTLETKNTPKKPLIDTIDDELIKARKNIKGALSDLEVEGNKASKKIQKQFHNDKEENTDKEELKK